MWPPLMRKTVQKQDSLLSHMEKIISPEFSEPLTQFRAVPPDPDNYTENAAFLSCDFSQVSRRRREFFAVKFIGCKFTQADLYRADFCNVEFRECDLSGASLGEARFDRVHFCGCKGLGTSFAEGFFSDICMEQCNFSYANFSESKFRSVLFSESDLSEGALSDCKGKQLFFRRVKLWKTDLSNTLLKGVDLSDCAAEGMILSQDLHELRGATVSQVHAAYFLRTLGIYVK